MAEENPDSHVRVNVLTHLAVFREDSMATNEHAFLLFTFIYWDKLHFDWVSTIYHFLLFRLHWAYRFYYFHNITINSSLVYEINLELFIDIRFEDTFLWVDKFYKSSLDLIITKFVLFWFLQIINFNFNCTIRPLKNLLSFKLCISTYIVGFYHFSNFMNYN